MSSQISNSQASSTIATALARPEQSAVTTATATVATRAAPQPLANIISPAASPSTTSISGANVGTISVASTSPHGSTPSTSQDVRNPSASNPPCPDATTPSPTNRVPRLETFGERSVRKFLNRWDRYIIEHAETSETSPSSLSPPSFLNAVNHGMLQSLIQLNIFPGVFSVDALTEPEVRSVLDKIANNSPTTPNNQNAQKFSIADLEQAMYDCVHCDLKEKSMSMRYKVYFDSFFVLLRARGWEGVPTMPEYAGPVVSLLVKCLTPMLLRCKLEDDLANGVVPSDSVDLFIAHVLDTCESAQPYCEAFDRIMVEQNTAPVITSTTAAVRTTTTASVMLPGSAAPNAAAVGNKNNQRVVAATVTRKQSGNRTNGNGKGNGNGGQQPQQTMKRNDSKHSAHRSNSASMSMSMSMSRSFSMDITGPDTASPAAVSKSTPNTPAADTNASPSERNRGKHTYNRQFQRRRNYRSMRKFVPDCLLPRCEGKHLLIHCPIATDEEKKTLLAIRRISTAATAVARSATVAKDEKIERKDGEQHVNMCEKVNERVEKTDSAIVINKEEQNSKTLTNTNTMPTSTNGIASVANSVTGAELNNNQNATSCSTLTSSTPSTSSLALARQSSRTNITSTAPGKQKKKLNVNAIEFEPVTPAANRNGASSASAHAAVASENVEELKQQARKTMDVAVAVQSAENNSNEENGVNDNNTNGNRATGEENLTAAEIEA